MPEVLEIRLVDSGQTAQTVADRAGSAPTPPTKQPAGAVSPEPSGASAASSVNAVLAASRPLAQALGVGGLYSAAMSVAKAFMTAADSVARFSARKPQAQPATSGGGSSPQSVSIPRASSAATEVDAEVVGATTQNSIAAIATKPPGLPAAGAAAAGAEVAGAAGGAGAAAGAEVAGAAGGAGAAAGGAGAATAATGAAAGVGATLAAVALPVLALAAAAAAAVLAIRALASAAHKEAERLAEYNPQLAGTMAMADIRAELADIRRAQRVAPGLSLFENDSSRIQTAIADANTAIMGVLSDIYRDLHPLIELVVKATELTAAGVGATAESVGGVIDLLTGQEWQDNVKRAAHAVGKMAKIMQDDRDEDMQQDPFMAAVLGQLGGANPLQANLPPPAAPAGAPGV